MRVAFFLDKYPALSETFIQSQINGLLEQGLDVAVIALNKGEGTVPSSLKVTWLYENNTSHSLIKTALTRTVTILSKLHSRNVRNTLTNKDYKALRAKGFFPTLVADWENHLDVLKFDVIIAHFGTTAVTANMLIQLGLLKGKLFAVFHGYDLSEKQLLKKFLSSYKKLFQQAEACLPVSELWANKLIEMGCPIQKVNVLRMGIDTSRFAMLGMAGEITQPLRLLSVARLTEKKGLDDAIVAVSLLQQMGITVSYRILGDGPLRGQLARLVEKLRLEHIVTLHGKASHDEVAEHLSKTDIFLLPSKTAQNGDQEGIPVSLMEAMSRGLICVSTYHSGIPELISHNIDGFLVPENAPGQLRRQAREKVERQFQQSKLNNQLAQLIQTTYG